MNMKRLTYRPYGEKGINMKGFNYINTGNTIKLKALMVSSDITDTTIIQVFDQEGKFLTKGNWFQDHVLDYSDKYGVATKLGTGLTVNFKLA